MIKSQARPTKSPTITFLLSLGNQGDQQIAVQAHLTPDVAREIARVLNKAAQLADDTEQGRTRWLNLSSRYRGGHASPGSATEPQRVKEWLISSSVAVEG